MKRKRGTLASILASLHPWHSSPLVDGKTVSLGIYTGRDIRPLNSLPRRRWLSSAGRIGHGSFSDPAPKASGRSVEVGAGLLRDRPSARVRWPLLQHE